MSKKVSTEAFEKAYARLNPRQREAVDTIDGPVMVIAGPGTGKTQILTLRIANILRLTDTPPDAVLALTFTEAGVRAMRKRLLAIIGPEAYRVPIYTFHAFCNAVISEYPEEFPRIIGSIPVSSVDQILLMQEIVLAAPLVRLRPYGEPLFYVRSALAAISDLKRENISPSDFEMRMAQRERNFHARPDLYHLKGAHKGKMKGEHQDDLKRIEKNKELAILYRAYELALRERKLYDYNDMILEVLHALENNDDLRLRLQEEYQYLLADEHQDANDSQNKLLELLSSFHENPNLFVVGDEKQAIYRFQGASLENFLYFKKLYPSAKIVSLEDNYRSSQRILDSAHSLIGKSKSADPELRTRLLARAGHDDVSLRIVVCDAAESEYLFVAHEIAGLVSAGVPADEIAVLYRENKDVFLLVRVLAKKEIPFTIESDQNILEDDEIKKLLILLGAVHAFGDDAALAAALHLDFLAFDEFAIYRLFVDARKQRRPIYELARAHDLFGPFVEKIIAWRKASKNENLLEVVERIMHESGFLGQKLAHPGSRANLEKIQSFFEEVKSFVEAHREGMLADLLAHFDVMREHRVSIKKHTSLHGKGVRLMTVHRSKGLEFAHVFVVGVYEGHWGGKRKSEQFVLPLTGADAGDESDDERRLFYVALTRAQKSVVLSYPQFGFDGREQLPSRFIDEIDSEHLEHAAPRNIEKPSALLLVPRTQSHLPSLYDKEYLNTIFVENGLSATAINNYLRCPWIYFYENLVRIPKSSSKQMMYGVAIHAALRIYFDKLKEGEDIGKEALVTLFEKYLEGQPLRRDEYDESLAKGRRALAGYYDQYVGSWNTATENEYAVPAVMLDEIRLVGAIDKMEMLGGDRVNVVDYKTGKPRSRNELMGKTKDASGDYFRQLVFYKLILSKHQEGRFQMMSGDIDFIEPDEKGRYHKEHFDITAEDVEVLESEIRRVAKEILDLAFWDRTCGDPECTGCALRALMPKDVLEEATS